MCRTGETPIDRMQAALAELPGWIGRQRDAAAFGDLLIAMGEVIDRSEAARAELLGRFEKSRDLSAPVRLSRLVIGVGGA